MKHSLLAFAAIIASASTAVAQPAIDGARDGTYGSALSVQTLETGFGDNFSELNAAYGWIDGTRLYVLLTGNLEANFNNLEVFIDSKAGGQSVFDSSGNANAGRMDGLVFDAGFTADYHMIFRRGSDSGEDRFDVEFANLTAQSASGYFDIMGGLSGTGFTGTGVNASSIHVGYDNSNVAGIGGNNGSAANQAAALAVNTGLEFSVDLADLGYTGGSIRVMAGVNGSGHDYWSNQFLGGLPGPQGNLGGDGAGGFTGEGAIDFTLFAGNQYFTVVPEPSSVALGTLAFMGTAFGVYRRRKQ